jgi:hypothetical protein
LWQKEFKKNLIKHGGLCLAPKARQFMQGTAVYAKKTERGPSATYYLTPPCKKSAKALIAYYAAEACEQPDKDSLIFLAGDSSFSS